MENPSVQPGLPFRGISRGVLVVFCIVLPIAILLFLIPPLIGLIGGGWDTLGVAICAALAVPPGVVSFGVALIFKLVSRLRNRRMRTRWLVPSIIAAMAPIALWATVVVIKIYGIR